MVLVPFARSYLGSCSSSVCSVRTRVPFGTTLTAMMAPDRMPNRTIVRDSGSKVTCMIGPSGLAHFRAGGPKRHVFCACVGTTGPAKSTDGGKPFVSVSCLRGVLAGPVSALGRGSRSVCKRSKVGLVAPVVNGARLALVFRVLNFGSGVGRQVDLMTARKAIPSTGKCVTMRLHRGTRNSERRCPDSNCMSFPLLSIPKCGRNGLRKFGVGVGAVGGNRRAIAMDCGGDGSAGFPFVRGNVSGAGAG